MAKRRKIETDNNGLSNSEENAIKLTYRKKTKCFSDLPHGDVIELNEALVKVINTVEFGRLHHIKQTGGCFLVYPSATHTRFAHSLGTCHLAGKVITRLRDEQPELEINDRDVLCVELAALLHDLGHGPFSHTFDQLFIPLARPGVKWQHEDASKEMFKHLLAKNPDVKAYLDEILSPEDYIFIEEAITPVTERAEWPYKGRPKEKAFLYDIVSNKAHGFDVDKWDYIRRDAAHTSVSTSANLSRLLKHMKVFEAGSRRRPTICYRDKVQQDLANLATTRAQLHMAAYQHRTVKVIEMMIVDALLIANDHLKFPGTNGVDLRLSDTISDMEAYKRLTDDIVFGLIFMTKSEELKPARELLDRIQTRRLYSKVAQADKVDSNGNEDEGNPNYWKNVSGQIAKYLSDVQREFPGVDEERLEKRIAVVVSDIHGGLKNEDPVEKVWFYRKDCRDAPQHYKRTNLSAVPPRQKIIRVFCREEDDGLIKCAAECFTLWCNDNGYSKPRKIMDDELVDAYDASRPGSVMKGGQQPSFSHIDMEAVKKDLMNDPTFGSP